MASLGGVVGGLPEACNRPAGGRKWGEREGVTRAGGGLKFQKALELFQFQAGIYKARLSGSRGNLSMNQTGFAVSQFRNRNGTISWQVDGRLNGVRIRKNFKTRDEAAVEKGTLELKAMQTEAGMRSVSTFLSEAQLREAETAFNRLKDLPRPARLLSRLRLGQLPRAADPQEAPACISGIPRHQEAPTAAGPDFRTAPDHHAPGAETLPPPFRKHRRG